MSLTTYHQHLFTNSPPRITLLFTTTTTTKTSSCLSLRNLTLSRHATTSLHSNNFHFKPQAPKNSFNSTLKAYQSDPTTPTQDSDQFNVDQFLSIAELLCIISSSIVTISYALNCTFPKRGVLGVIGSNAGFAWGMVVMVSGVLIGAWIRTRQWWRICRETDKEWSRESLNLMGRIEKLEDDLRSSATIIRVLSRQLEKLGIRFRVTRKALKEPIAEDSGTCADILRPDDDHSLEWLNGLPTAALAQKNSEATRALAVQEDILEKELGEIQKNMLQVISSTASGEWSDMVLKGCKIDFNLLSSLQEQQQKQLELILAIGKSGKLWDNRREPVLEQEMIKTADVNQLETHETQSPVTSKGRNNDRP
ncbi:unnamed protein product [Dovyalis caffra]|uniref:Uncharacterized protein n=1 Tax=Dovyalis caffra TaxID=77055 RepID=A0AAV1SLV0_9ROSI|nr:unnamed protein product [Dovyalis caffra]